MRVALVVAGWCWSLALSLGLSFRLDPHWATVAPLGLVQDLVGLPVLVAQQESDPLIFLLEP